MPNDDPSSSPKPGPSDHLLGLDPGELLARGMQTVPPTGGGGGKGWTPPEPEDLARLLPQYEIECLLGAGGMGAVYKGRQAALDRPVAIKLLPAEMTSDEQFTLRFQREARLLAKIQHPGIVAVYDFGQTSEGHLYFVMEYVDGSDLRRVLRTSKLTPDQALELVGQICDALQAAHKQGVVHRDIKPENILISTEGRVKLADFGLSRPLSEDTFGLTMSNMVMGTVDYMSPEQRSGEADERTDIFALGIVLYEMLTGKPPRGSFDPPSRKVQIDVRIDQIVLKALQEEPNRRYQQVSEFKTDVDRLRGKAPRLSPKPKPTPAPRPATPAPPASPASVSPARLAIYIASAVLAAALIVWLILWLQPLHRAGQAAAPPATPAPLQITYVQSASAAPYPIGQRGQTTEQPTAVFAGTPVNFNQHTGNEVHFKIDSPTPIVRVSYTGKAFSRFTLAAIDSTGAVLATSDPISAGGNERSVEINVPGTTHFELVITNHSPDWLLIEQIRLDDASGAVAWTPPGTTSALAGASPVPTPTAIQPAAVPIQTLDLLALTDPIRDREVVRFAGSGTIHSRANQWERRNTSLVYVTDGSAGQIGAPVDLRARSYEMEVEFERLSGEELFLLGMPISPGRVAPLIFRPRTRSTDWENWPAGQTGRARVIARLDIGAQGQTDHLLIKLNGNTIVDWRGDAAKRSMPAEELPDFRGAMAPYIHMKSGSYAVTFWQLRVFDGQATVLNRPAAAERPSTAPPASQPSTSTVSTTTDIQPSPAVPKQTLDLLALTDPVRDRETFYADTRNGKLYTGANQWERRGSSLVYATDGSLGQIAAPVDLRARSYEIEAEFEYRSGTELFGLVMPLESGPRLTLIFAPHLPIIIDTNHNVGTWPEGQTRRQRVIARIDLGTGGQSDYVIVTLNGTTILDWRGKASQHCVPIVEQPSEISRAMAPALYSFSGSYNVTFWQLRVLDGQATVLNRPAAAGQSSTQAAGVSPDASERLRELQSLFDQGLVTKEAYESKRAEILGGRQRQ